MNLEYPKLVGPCLFSTKSLFLSQKTPNFHLSQCNVHETCNCQIQLLAESSNLWHTLTGSTSVLTRSERGMRENIAHLFSTNSHVCFCLFLFHLLVAHTKKKKRKHKTSTTSEAAPKPVTISSLHPALPMLACPFAAIIPQLEYKVTDEHPSLWIYPQELRNVAPLKAHLSTSCWFWLLERSTLPDPLRSLMDYRAEISYSLHVKESHIEQHPAAKDCYFTWQFHNYSICYLTNMYI